MALPRNEYRLGLTETMLKIVKESNASDEAKKLNKQIKTTKN